MKQQIRYGCIGTGWISRLKHLKQYSTYSHVHICGVVDSDAGRVEKTAAEIGINDWYTDPDQFIKEQKPDLVSICVPNAFHYPLLKNCLENGIAVHCEKPLVTSIQEAEDIRNIILDGKAYLFVGMNKRYASYAVKMKELIDSGAAGNIYHIQMRWQRKRGIPGKGGWFTNKALSGGGVLIDLGVHLIDLALHLLDFPKVIEVAGRASEHFMKDDTTITSWAPNRSGIVLETDTEDDARLFMVTDKGTTISIETSWAANIPEDEIVGIRCLGTKAGLHYKENEGLLISNAESVTKLIEPINGGDEFDRQCAGEVKDCLEGYISGSSASTVNQALSVQRIIEAVYQQTQKSFNKEH